MFTVLIRITTRTIPNKPLNSVFRRTMTSVFYSDCEEDKLKIVRTVIPQLTLERHKGQCGRVGIFGGSIEYTGAPYFAAISALKVGCDLVHVFCHKEAAPVIKSYSPELIVHPLLDDKEALELIKPWLSRLHVLLIGPGLGRTPQILNTITNLIDYCRHSSQLPLVIDADGMFLVTEKPQIIQNYPAPVILTPNIIEFSRLFEVINNKKIDVDNIDNDVVHVVKYFGNKTVAVVKGSSDVIASANKVVHCQSAGCPRRCGGQGDLLSGSITTFLAWAQIQVPPAEELELSTMIAGFAGCRLIRECSKRSFCKMGRSMVASDMIREIKDSFHDLYESTCG